LKRRGRGIVLAAPGKYLCKGCLAVIVVVVIPVAVGVPAMAVFVPPAVIGVPAVFAGFAQLRASAIRLFAIPAMMLRSFVQIVVRFDDAVLALTFIGAQTRSSREHEKAA